MMMKSDVKENQVLDQLKSLADGNQIELYKKFPASSILSVQEWCLHFIDWVTFYRRNIHLFARDYLGLRGLYLYQLAALYEMGINSKSVFIASRSAAKTYLTAIYACCIAILYPGIKIVVASATISQASLIINEKIKGELWNASAMLRRELGNNAFSKERGWPKATFLNGSTIIVVPASDTARGNRSNILIRDEFRLISKSKDDEIITPFQVVYTPPFRCYSDYNSIANITIDTSDVFLSSSWLDDGHWMWNDVVDPTIKDMRNGKDVILLAVDEAVVLKHKIKTRNFLEQTKKKLDPLTWRLEILNERVKENNGAYFTYKMLSQCQHEYMPFYPRMPQEIRSGKKNPYFIKKGGQEIRIVSCDMAFAGGDKNDNSVFTCMAATPEVAKIERDGEMIETLSGYRRRVDCIWTINGGDTDAQALQIRRLYNEYNADYIVLDTRNGGISVFDKLAKPMYDPETGKTYEPLTCMNNDDYAERIRIPGAQPRIYAINASSRLNSEIAVNFRSVLVDKMIDLPVNLDVALEKILPNIKEYTLDESGDIQNFYETPFLESQAFISESNQLLYKKDPKTGIITVYESGNNRKDRYTSISYGSHFIDQLARDLISDTDEFDVGIFVS